MRFTVVGGDLRQAMLCELLAIDGHRVTALGFDKLPNVFDNVEMIDKISEIVNTECFILPLPCCSSSGVINTPFASGVIMLEHLLEKAEDKTVVFAGRLLDEDMREFAKRGITYADYLEREELAVLNAVATAEGAVQIAMEESACTVHASECLIIGYGRIGKVLAGHLKNLGARVTVSSRKYADKAWCTAYGYTTADTGRLEGNLGRFDMVFNTVPAMVMPEKRLKELKKDCLCIDLASKPGGIDMSGAQKLGIRCIWALSLPGKVAPLSAGKIIRDTIYNMLEERGLL